MMNFNAPVKLLLLMLFIFYFNGCGGESDHQDTNIITDTTQEKRIVGYLVDAPVENMDYLCGGAEGVTNNEGKFECPTLPVIFKIDSFVIAKVETLPEDKTVYPQDLVGVPREEISHPEVLKVASFLQSLDSDGDLSTINILENITIDTNQTLLEMTPEEIHLLLTSQNIIPVTLDEAEAHLQESMGVASEENNQEEFNSSREENNEINIDPNINTLNTAVSIPLNDTTTLANNEINEINITDEVNITTDEIDITDEVNTTTDEINTTDELNITDELNTTDSEKYTYIPTEENLTNALAIRFLNKATFGATKADIEHLQEIGVEKWVDEQLAKPLVENNYLIKTIELTKEAAPLQNPSSVEEYIADNDTVFNKEYASFHSPTFMQSAWFDIAMTSPDQLRHKLAYALSQIIVESDFEPIFIRRGEALSRYFDILAQDAFSSYKQLLTDITFNSGMSMFLTYNGSKALYLNDANVSVYPDENYAREIMQLFSIGLNKINIDGTAQKDAQGNLIPTYTQEDVNELARVFTGWDIQRNRWFGDVGFTVGDLTHPIEFTEEYHDFGEKSVLGEKISAGLSGEDDIKKAIDIIMSNANVAPFISKNLIMRLTKSNPTPAYIARVATVFNSTNGDLKAVTKAILLDEEIWEDIKNLRSVKFKEPIVALTNFYRVLDIKPLPYWYFCGFGGPEDDEATNCTKVYNKFLFNNPINYLNQGPARAPTVFNFYDNSFVPNDSEFKSSGEVAPEVQIQNDTILINFNNMIRRAFDWEEIRLVAGTIGLNSIEEITEAAPTNGYIPFYYIGADKFLFNLKEDYDFLELIIDGNTDGNFTELKDSYQDGNITNINYAVKEYINFVDNKLMGGLLSDTEKDIIYKELSHDENGFYNHWAGDDSADAKLRQVMDEVIRPLYRFIVTSDKFMTE